MKVFCRFEMFCFYFETDPELKLSRASQGQGAYTESTTVGTIQHTVYFKRKF